MQLLVFEQIKFFRKLTMAFIAAVCGVSKVRAMSTSELVGTKTLQNLKDAFAGESMANRCGTPGFK